MPGGPPLQHHGARNLPTFPGRRVRAAFLHGISAAARWTTGAGVLIVAPMGEEMNKCRRMMALAARALQAAGLGALYIDCYGTGDSAGRSSGRHSDALA